MVSSAFNRSKPLSVITTSTLLLSTGHSLLTNNSFTLSLSTILDASLIRSSIRSFINLMLQGLGCCPLKIRNTLYCCIVISEFLKKEVDMKFNQFVVYIKLIASFCTSLLNFFCCISSSNFNIHVLKIPCKITGDPYFGQLII